MDALMIDQVMYNRGEQHICNAIYIKDHDILWFLYIFLVALIEDIKILTLT